MEEEEREARLRIMADLGWELSPAIPLLLSWTFFCRAVVLAKKTLGEDEEPDAVRGFITKLKWYHVLRRGGISEAGDMADKHACSSRHSMPEDEFITDTDLPTEVRGAEEMESLDADGSIVVPGVPHIGDDDMGDGDEEIDMTGGDGDDAAGEAAGSQSADGMDADYGG